MARPETVNHSRIRRDCEAFLAMSPVAGSPHRRRRSASFGRGETCLRCVRSGEQGREVWSGIAGGDASRLWQVLVAL